MQVRLDIHPDARRAARRRRHHLRRLSRLLAGLLSSMFASLAAAQILPPAPTALPTGGQVVVGAGRITQSGAQMVINQSTARLGLDWQRFDIGSQSSVEFRQPDANSIALNRVLGNDASALFGRLSANGQVFLTNPNGVLFAPGAKVDVGGLVASTLDLSQQDFADGRLLFRDVGGTGVVRNQGRLSAGSGGYLALFGNQVANDGEMAVDAGSVVLAAGRAATVSISGSGLLSAVVAPGTVAGSIANSGRILADGGVVTLSAKSAQDIAASLVNNSGIVRANTLAERGGEIWLSGDTVMQTGQLSAAAPAGGDAGRITLLADMKHGSAAVAGTLDASAVAGQGGFIETSGAKVKLAGDTHITTAAPGGRTGTWLLDPNDFSVAPSGGDQTGAFFTGQLVNTNATISTLTGGTAGNGDIFIRDSIAWSANRLTLIAERNISIESALTGSGTATLALQYGQGALAANNTATYSVSAPVTLPAGANFSTKLGSNGTTVSYTVLGDLAGLQAVDGNAAALAANYVLGADIDASSTATANGGLGFNPIGNEASTSLSTTNSFSGRFDGLGHSISGLVIARPSAAASGLFGNTNNATIRNLTLAGGSVSGLTNVGAVVGLGGGTTSLEQVHSSATVTGSANSGAVGGLVGSLAAGTITHSSVGSTGNLVTISGGNWAGGLVGDGGTGDIRNTQAFVSLSGAAIYAGGLAGQTHGVVADSSSAGSVQTTGNAWVGGLVGSANNTVTFSNVGSSADVSTTHSSSYTGGLFGGAYSVSLNGGSATGAVSGGVRTGGLIGDFSSVSSGASISNASSSGNVSGIGSVGGLVGYATGNGSLSAVSASGAVSNNTASGDIGGAVGYLALTGALTAVTSSGSVSGGNYAGGVVGELGTNLALTPANVNNTAPASGSKTVSGVNYAGGLVGYSSSTAALSGFSGADTLSVNVTATGTGGVAGGLAGRTNGPVNSASASGTVSAAANAGGLVGVANGAGGFNGATASGAVTGTGTSASVGGLVGNYSNTGNLTGGTASGSVQGGSGSGAVTGGLVGSFSSAGSIVNGSTATTSTVIGGGSTGGLVGRASGSGSAAITGSTARGSVTGSANAGAVGGLVGDFSMPGGWSTVGAEGAVSGGYYTGGLVGFYSAAAAITGGSFTGGSVTGGTWVGGGVGYMNSTAAISGLSAQSPWLLSANVTSTGTGGAAGVLAGRTDGAVSNVTASGTVIAANDAGGLVGNAAGAGGFSAVIANGNVSTSGTTSSVGGLVGNYSNSGALADSRANGAVAGGSGGGSYSGGLVGYFSSAGGVSNGQTAVTTTVSGGGYVGGLLGYATGGGTAALAGSTARGAVTGTGTGAYAGGLAGQFSMPGGWGAVSATGLVSGGYYAGGLAGLYNTSADITGGSYTGASVSGLYYVGGLVGYMSSAAAISGPSAASPWVVATDVTATNAGATAGGVVGRSSGGLSNLRSTGAVTSAGLAGGMAGLVDSAGALTDVSATGAVRGSSNAGGLVGQFNSSGAITRATASGSVFTNNTGGGLIGTHYGGVVTQSSASGAVTGLSDSTVYLGGLIGQFGASCYYCNPGYEINRSTATGNVRADAGGSYVGGLVGLMFSGNITGTVGSNSSASGKVSSYDAVSPNNGNQYVGGLVGNFGYYSNSGSISNSNASGAVNGGYYTGGLVGYFNGTDFKDSRATGAVTAGGYTGGLAGWATAYGTMSTLSATGAVVANTNGSYIGGLIGYLAVRTGSSLSNGRASGAVSQASTNGYLGGLIGYLDVSSGTLGAINDSGATGNVSGGSTAGGLIGYAYNYYGSTAILNSSASGNVSGGSTAGGLVGEYYRVATTGRSDDITSSYATGNISASTYVGGLVGSFRGSAGVVASYATGNVTGQGINGAVYLGGLAGWYYANNTTGSSLSAVSRSYASGRVQLVASPSLGTSSTVYAGGLVGYLQGNLAANGVVDSYATGAVVLAANTGRLYAGGLVGSSTNQSLLHTYATGAVSATGGSLRATGGLLAQGSTVTATSSHWDTSTTGQASSVGIGGSGLSTAQMYQASNFSDWNFGSAAAGTGNNTWRIYDGYTAPLLLKDFLTPLGLSLSDASKPYDGTRSFGVGNLGGAILSDRVFAATPSADVGSYSVAAAGVYSVQNGYDLNVAGGATLSITPRALTLAGVVADKVYDGTRTAALLSTAQPAGIVQGESLTVNLGSASAVFDTKDVGQDKTVTVSGVTLGDGSNGKASNYTLSASTTTASITPKALNAGGFTASNRAYDGFTTVAVSAAGGTVTGRLGSDDVSVDVASVNSGTVASKDVGTAKRVTVSGATLSGADAGNYVIAGIDGVTVDITPRQLTVNGLVGSNRSYDQSINVNVPTATGVLAGVVPGDTVQLRGNNVTGQMANRNAGTGKTVTVPGSSLVLRGSDAANYAVASASATVDIARATVNFYADYNGIRDKVYDGNALATTIVPFAYPSLGYVLFGTTTTLGIDNLTLSYSAPGYSDKNVAYSNGSVTSKTITVANAVLGGTDVGNYVLANTSATTTGRITPLPLSVTGVSATNRPYNGTTTVAVNVSAANVNSAAVVQGDQVTVTLPGSGTVDGTIANKNVGNSKPVTVPGFSLGGADAGNYSLTGSSGVTVNITPKPLTATYTALDKVYDGNAAARISVASTDIVGGDQLFFYADTSNYGCYGCYGLFVSNTSTPTSYAQSKDVATSKRVVVVDNGLFGSDSGNYTLLNRTATLTASITPKGITPVFTGVNKVYDGNTTASVNVNTGASGIVSGDAVSLDRTATFSTKDVGTGKNISISGIAFTGVNASNYTLATTTATATAAITPKLLSVQGVAASDRAYDGTTSVGLTVGTLAGGGVVGSDAVTVVPPAGGISTGTMANKGVGTGKVVTVAGLTLAGTDAGNYTIDGSQGVTVNIAQRDLTVSYTGVDREYTGGVAATVTPGSTSIAPGDVLSFNQNAVFTGLGAKDVGTNKPVAISSIELVGASVAGSTASNYRLLNTTASTTAGITAKTIGVVYGGLSRVYNGLDDHSANVLGTSTGIVPGDLVSFKQTALFVDDGSAGSAKPVNVSGIELVGLQANNYSLLSTSATTTATITPRPLGISGVLATNRIYDGTRSVQLSTAGASVLPAGVLAGDTVSVVLPSGGITTGTVATKDAGTNKDVTITGITLSGASQSNYSVVGASGITVDIAPKPLTAVYSAASRVYDGTTLAGISGNSADILTGDFGAIGISATGAFGNKSAGTGKAVAISGGFLTGAERNNYTLLNPGGSALADITPKMLTPSYSGGTRVYDGSVTAPVTALGTGLVGGDVVSYGQTAVFTGADAKNVATGKAIAISNIVLSGTDAANYSLLADTASTTGGITPKPISIEGLTGVTATPRTYDGTRSVDVVVSTSGTLAPRSADIVAGDSVSINLPSGGITTGTLADKNAGANKPLVVDGLTLAGTDASNYLVTATSGVTVDIARKPLTAVYTGINKVYDGDVAATVGGQSADIIFGDAVAVGGAGVFLGSGARNVGTAKAVSVISGQLTGNDASNYALVNPTGSTASNITPKPVAPTYTGLDKVYDGTTTALVAAGSTGFITGDAVLLSQTALFTGNKNVGTGKPIAISGIALSGSDATNYALATTSASTTGSITPRPLRIDGLTGVSATDRVYDGSKVVSVVVSASGPVIPNPADVIAGDVVGVNAPSTGSTTGTMLDKNVGTAKPVEVSGLNLTGADATNYSIAATSGVTVNITPLSVTAVYSAGSRVYDGTVAASITGSSTALISGDTVTIAGSGVFTGTGAKNVGSGKAVDVLSASLSGADAANYSLLNPTGSGTGSISQRPVTVSYLGGGTRVYDGTIAAPVAATTSGFIANDQVSVLQTAEFTGSGAKNVGTDKPVTISGISLAGTDAANYSFTSTSIGVTASITPRPLRIDGFTGVVATNRVYDGTTAVAVSVQGSGSIGANTADLVPGDDIAVIAPTSGSTAGTLLDKNAGSNKPVIVSGVTLSGADKDNYSVAAANGVTVTIAPKPLTAGYIALNKVYDGNSSATITGNSVDVVAGDHVSIGGTGLFVDGKSVGIGKTVSINGGTLGDVDAANYSLLNTQATVSASITAKSLTASYTGGTRVYDGTASAPVTGALAGLVAGDSVSFGQTALFAGSDGRNVGSGKAVNITAITLAGSDAANYSLLSTSGATTASITPKPITVEGITGVQATDRVYDGTTAVAVTVNNNGGNVAPVSSDIIAGDVVTIGGVINGQTTGTMLDKNVGINKAVNIAGLTLTGADAANYSVGSIGGVRVSISPLILPVTGLAAVDRAYDGTTTVTLNSSLAGLSGVLAGDDVHLPASGATGSMADKMVGNQKPVTVGSLTLSGTDAGNYGVASAGSLSVNITPKSLTASYTGLPRVYDGTTAASVKGASADIIGTDVLSIGAAGTFTGTGAADVGIAKPIAVSGGNLSGADASNYSLSNPTGSASADITPRKVSVAANIVVRTADDPNPTDLNSRFSANPGGLVNGDHIASITATLPPESVGAAGLSIFDITPSSAIFDSGKPGNYELSYQTGKLIVLPSTSIQSQGSGSPQLVAFLDAELQALAVQAPQALNQTSAVLSQSGPPAEPGALRRRLNALASPTYLSLPAQDPASNGAQITLPSLQRTPLISFDPSMRRLLTGNE